MMACGRNYVIPETDHSTVLIRTLLYAEETQVFFHTSQNSFLRKNRSVELWDVGPQSQEMILDIKQFCPDANLRRDQERWRLWKPTDCSSCLVWIVYTAPPEYKDVKIRSSNTQWSIM